MKHIKRTGALLVLGLALITPSLAHAGGNLGQMIAKLHAPKTAGELGQIKPGGTIAKVCRACNQVTLVRVMKPGKGQYDYVARKCEDCGSDNTFVAISRPEVSFKERIKR